MEKHLPIEELLYEEESTTLDFKREAFSFVFALQCFKAVDAKEIRLD